MKIPLYLSCPKCQTKQYVWILLHADEACYICQNKKCLHERSFGFSIETMRLGWRLLLRSQYELIESKDYALSIVMSACAFDVDVSRLNIKWQGIRELEKGQMYDPKILEQELLKHRKVIEKLKSTGKLLSLKGFNGYVKDSKKYQESISSGFNNIDLDNPAQSFIEALFYPRNEILHMGKNTYTEEQARSCHNTALLGLNILWEMDLDRRKLRKES